MFQRILVPIDGSEQAQKGFKYALNWAKKQNGTIILIHVVDIKLLEGPLFRDVGTVLGMTPWTNYQNQIRTLLEERGMQYLNVCEEECIKNNVPCEKILTTGIVSSSILQHSELCDILILVKSGEHTRWLDGFMGGTTHAVIRRSKRPVIITNQSEFHPGPILLAYDGSSSAREALRISAELTKLWNTNCHVVHVSNPPEEEVINEAISYLEANKVNLTSHLIRDNSPVNGILNIIKEVSPVIVTMGAFGKNRVHEWLLGSNTSSIIHTAECPVLLTRLK
ncbi:MAG TPA: universal stress protein [Candidatus Hydrogenedens sp.]|nr:universal stress protein [Candidatus Hydrogenedens sp.]HOK08512.1 universal stress protein [Candidatus Hydrogenedens sp.]HOL19000.1 universal stress protein [Candidatus Hydrogenedens sp.]HPP57818.1 universal stress protein [Candidatus Hydrogenedens sp.]